MFEMPKPEFTPEFRELAVMRVKPGLTIGGVAREPGADSLVNGLLPAAGKP